MFIFILVNVSLGSNYIIKRQHRVHNINNLLKYRSTELYETTLIIIIIVKIFLNKSFN